MEVYLTGLGVLEEPIDLVVEKPNDRTRGLDGMGLDFSASFELAMARKDVRLMIETAGELPLAVLNGMAERMDRLLAEGHGAEDAGVMAREAIRAMT